jgi:hypothetical protein
MAVLPPFRFFCVRPKGAHTLGGAFRLWRKKSSLRPVRESIGRTASLSRFDYENQWRLNGFGDFLNARECAEYG